MIASMRGGTAPLGPGYTKPTLGTVGCCPNAKNGKPITTLTTNVMNPRRRIAAPEVEKNIVAGQTRPVKGCPDVRFGSKADICAAKSDVRYYPNRDRESGFPQTVMS